MKQYDTVQYNMDNTQKQLQNQLEIWIWAYDIYWAIIILGSQN